MIRKIHERISMQKRWTKILIVLILLAIILILAVTLQKPDLQEEYLKNITSEFVMNGEIYTLYNGSSLRLVRIVEGECQDCYVAEYTFDVATDKLLSSIKGFSAFVNVENNQTTDARYVRVLK